MFRTTLHLILIVTVATCPLWCKAGGCTDGCAATSDRDSARCESHSCCERAASQHEEPGSRPTEPSNDAPCDSCQCICSGAVMESQDEDLRQQVEHPLSDMFVVAEASVDALDGQPRRTAPPGEHPKNSGHDLRILHASLLL